MKKITLNHISKIEGHAKLQLKISSGEIKKCKLEIFEGARFFNELLVGKKWNDIASISSRICGACSVVHTLTALKAIEKAFNIEVTEQTKQLRELLQIGGTIQSHALHVYFMCLPDYLGYTSALTMASEKSLLVQQGLKIKRLGNQILKKVAGRDVHPIAAVVGGFSRLPGQHDIKQLLPILNDTREDAVQAVKVLSELEYPEIERDTRYFGIDHMNLMYGNILELSEEHEVSLSPASFEAHMKEYFEENSNAEFVLEQGKSYMVGSLARMNINNKFIPQEIKDLIDIKLPNNNPFMNLLCQAAELVFYIDKAINIIENIHIKQEQPVQFSIKESKGIAASEAPRGLVFYNLSFDKNGYCKKADIVTPTSQNLRQMELDIKQLVESIIDQPKEEIKKKIEMLIRAYDPCISCSTHFLEIKGL